MKFKPSRPRGQTSMEFMIALAAVIMMFIVASYFIYFKISRTMDYKLYVYGKHAANELSSSINTVNQVGPGYSMKASLPPRLHGNRMYDVVFYRDEPTVFFHGSSFSTGDTLFFSAPVSTTEIQCLLDDCYSGCNESPEEICLNVGNNTDFRLSNYGGSVYFTPPSNIRQPGLESKIIPFIFSEDPYENPYHMNNETVRFLIGTPPWGPSGPPLGGGNFPNYMGGADIPLGASMGGVVFYLARSSESGELFLVTRIHDEAYIEVDLKNYTGNPVVNFSDDEAPLEYSMGLAPEGQWDTSAGAWDGGILALNTTGFRLCMQPSFISNGMYWLNPGGAIILDETREVCINYP